MLPKHLKALKDSRKVFTKNKLINYNSNFIEHVMMDKGMYVFPKNDELLEMINSIHIFDELEQFDYVMEHDLKEWVNYDFNSLPDKLKNYMAEKDYFFYSIECNRHFSTPDYDRREERLFSMRSEVSIEEFERYVLLGHSIPTALGKKAKDSARRAFYTVTDYIRCNVHLFKQFVTLTFAMEKSKGKLTEKNKSRMHGEYDLEFEYIDPTDFELTKSCYSLVMTNLRNKLKRKGIPFYYITVWELQDNGNYHFHMLCSEIPSEFLYSVPEWLDIDYRSGKRFYGQGLKEWKYGKSDVQAIKSPSKVSTYVSKYIIKSFHNVNEQSYEEYLNKRKFFPSTNLTKSDKSYSGDSDFDKVLEEFKLEKEKAYSKEYINPYSNGLITKNIYTFV